jgi:hypothetical protein
VTARQLAVGARGQTLVEAAMVIPLVLILALGLAGVSQLGQADAAVLAVAQEAARAGATANSPALAVEAGVTRGLSVGSGYRLGNGSLRVSVDPSDFRRGGQVRVTAEYDVSLVGLEVFRQSRIIIRRQHSEPIDLRRNMP